MNKDIKIIKETKQEQDQIWCADKMKKGLTMIEIMVAVTILFGISAISASSFINWRNSKNIEAGTDIVLSVLKEARNLSVNGKGGDSYGVYFGETDKAILFRGVSYSPPLVVSTTSLPLNISISTSTLGETITFKKFSGNTNGNGIIIIKDNSNASNTRTINIEASGSLSTN